LKGTFLSLWFLRPIVVMVASKIVVFQDCNLGKKCSFSKYLCMGRGMDLIW
jgi:hypothetical protein